ALDGRAERQPELREREAGADVQQGGEDGRQEVKMLVPVHSQTAVVDQAGLGERLKLPADLEIQLGATWAAESLAEQGPPGDLAERGREAAVPPDQAGDLGGRREWGSVDDRQVEAGGQPERAGAAGGLRERLAGRQDRGVGDGAGL